MFDLLVVGAGPYGLSIASHAASAGLSLRVFGRPMASWRDHMPRGMFLKSEPWASNLSDPAARWRLDAYCETRGVSARHGEPIPVEVFAEYGLWFARNAVPEVDERTIVRISPHPGGFEAVTDDGETVHARTVALAIGVMPFVEIPSALHGVSPDLVTHSSHHSSLDRFRERDVTVIGGGQAALETAALLAEQGTKVRVLARADRLDWNDVPPSWERPWWQSLRSPHSGLGCGWRNWFYSERAGWYRRLPEETRARIAADALGPAGAWWVRDRVEGMVEVLLGHEVTAAEGELSNSAAGKGASAPGKGKPGPSKGKSASGKGRSAFGKPRTDAEKLKLEITDSAGRTRSIATDHVISATGFKATRDRLALLSPELRGALAAVADGSPSVGREFESSWPGLFMAGLVTASGFGPAMRFVHGATFTSGTLVRGVRRRLRTGVPGGAIPAPGRSGERSADAVRR
ncbi:NAD(P)-binding domain-containing protein [Streptomyces acidiscabies]|uniref:Dimethylaniline monooxygenase n=1 Tax=Streptomyces acidiscabies TaxID=42234 RepID=A0A0L0KBX3_9ACTN|nr:NAD(P)-binding domain-containing protein [Streptomyces acidiscabies]KND35577.1 dimethylaniline monooxygenase [Streptomyces acidiscabies]